MDKKTLMLMTLAIMDVLTTEGAPEGHIYMALMQGMGMNLDGFQTGIEMMVKAGVLVRKPGPMIAPGPMFGMVKAALDEARKGS